jgi:hypothetical protein
LRSESSKWTVKSVFLPIGRGGNFFGRNRVLACHNALLNKMFAQIPFFEFVVNIDIK